MKHVDCLLLHSHKRLRGDKIFLNNFCPLFKVFPNQPASLSAESEIYLNDIKGMENLAHTFAKAYASISTTSPGCTELDARKLSREAHVKKLRVGF